MALKLVLLATILLNWILATILVIILDALLLVFVNFIFNHIIDDYDEDMTLSVVNPVILCSILAGIFVAWIW